MDVDVTKLVDTDRRTRHNGEFLSWLVIHLGTPLRRPDGSDLLLNAHRDENDHYHIDISLKFDGVEVDFFEVMDEWKRDYDNELSERASQIGMQIIRSSNYDAEREYEGILRQRIHDTLTGMDHGENTTHRGLP